MNNSMRTILKKESMRVAALVVLLWLGTAMQACAQSGQGQSDDALAHGVIRQTPPRSRMPVGRVRQIMIDSRAPFYSPAEVSTEVGDVVQWANPEHSDPHTVYEEAGEFSSPQIPPGSEWCRQFTREGDYPYSCRIHPWMHGIVHVHAKDIAMRDLPLPGYIALVSMDADRGGLWVRSRAALLLVRETSRGSMEIVRRIPIPSSRHFLFDRSGNVWLPAPQPGGMIRVSLATGFSRLVQVKGLSGTLAPLAASTADDIWASDLESKQILRLRSESGRIISRFSADSIVWGAPALASSDGHLWVTAKSGKSLVSIDGRTGDRAEYHLGEGAQIKALRESSHGVIWAADKGRGKLLRIQDRWITEYTIPTNYSSPVDLQPDSRGWIWFTEMEADKIGVLRVGGAFDEYRVPAATHGPASLRFDHLGNLWFLAVKSGSLGRIASVTIAGLDQAASFDLPACAAARPPNPSGNRVSSFDVPASRKPGD